jgi:ribosomal RNA-processing protein 12
MVIPDENEQMDQDDSAAARNVEGTAFMSAQTGVDGATRDARGNLKFNKNTKRSRMEDDDMDVDFDESIKKAYMPEQKKKKKQEGNKRLGEEFRAKVSVKLHTG